MESDTSGGIEAVWDYVSCMAFLLPVIFVMHLRFFFNPSVCRISGNGTTCLPASLYAIRDMEVDERFFKVGESDGGVVGVLILCVLPATMSRSAWVAAVIGCVWVIYMHRDRA